MDNHRDNSAELHDWLRQLVRSFRSHYLTLSVDERRFVSNLDDLSSPCQVELIWFQPPDLQYAIVTHFADRKDLDIAVHGPFPVYEAVDRLEKILGQPKWDLVVEPEPHSHFVFREGEKFRVTLEGTFINIIHDLRGASFRKPLDKPLVGSKSFLTPKAFIWNIVGNLVDTSPSDMASEIVDGAKKQAEAAQKSASPPPPSEPEPRIEAHGGFIFPPVWIGRAPRQTFREKIAQFPLFLEKAYEGTYKGRLLIADVDGFVAVAESDKLKATALLNEIMAIRLLGGKATYALREREVAETHIHPEKKHITSKSVPEFSPRASLMLSDWSTGPWSILPREVISIEEMDRWLTTAEKMTHDPDFSETMRFLLEASTSLENSEYLETFVLSWVIIERDLYSRWKQYLRDQNLSLRRRRKLENPGDWGVDRVIEGLSLAGRISPDEYEKIMPMKALRNDIIHEGERVSSKQAEQSFELALHIVQRRTGSS